MSAPKPNPDKRNRRNRPVVIGIKGAMVIAAFLMIVVVFVAVVRSTDRLAPPAPIIDLGSQQN